MRTLILLCILFFCLVIALSGCGSYASKAPLIVTSIEGRSAGWSNTYPEKYRVSINGADGCACGTVFFTDSLYAVGDTIQ